jgi:hypothetical protein
MASRESSAILRSVKATNFKVFLLAATLAAVASAHLAIAGTLFTSPIISVSPRAIDFGAVPMKTSVTNTFLIENWGGGKLVGKATVPPPFKIISGAAYQLGPSDAQVVTIAYTPSGALLDTNIVKFTGGAGAVAPVKGKSLGKPELSKGK